jgi:N-acetylglucosaminyldiphosphoundecaprenol N-acetyl-beta-D-mannosaminyltransferase
MKPVRLLNAEFHPLTLEGTVDLVFRRIEAGERGSLCTVNVAILMMMREDPRLQRFVDAAAIVVADGEPLIWSSRAMARALPERVTGVDLVEGLCARAAREGAGVYLLGAERSVVDQVAAGLTQRHHGLVLSGVEDGYFGPEQAAERAQAVADSGAKILVVAMGVPKQEYFLQDHWQRLGVPFAIGVGGSFDVLAGLRVRAPELVQRAGMEWAFRLVQEPRRLWKRYLVTNSQFLYLMSRELIKKPRD